MATYGNFVICPYDSSHVVTENRLQYHIIRCQKNHSDDKKVACPYNAIHIVDQIYLQAHLKTCPNAGEVQMFEVQMTPNKIPGIVSLEQVNGVDHHSMVGFENWENNARYFTYDGFEQSKNRPVIRTLMGASKTERRLFREQETARMAKFDQELDDEPLRIPHVRRTSNKQLQASSNVEQEQESVDPVLSVPRAEKPPPTSSNAVNEPQNLKPKTAAEKEENEEVEVVKNDVVKEKLKQLELKRMYLEVQKTNLASTKSPEKSVVEAEENIPVEKAVKTSKKVGRCAANFTAAVASSRAGFGRGRRPRVPNVASLLGASNMNNPKM